MNHLKTLLLWLLLAALPMQGYAAVSSFMAMQGRSAPTPTAAHHHAAASPQLAASDHCAMHAQTGHAHCGADRAKAKCGSCGSCGSGGCVNCASCCVGGAMAAPVPACAPPDLRPAGSEAIPYRLRHMSAHIPAGPERPPHPIA
jgi:hypothetical protein